MNAITLLKRQHREVAELFKHLHKARTAKQRQQIFEMIADDLAIHATIEERHFYPSVNKKATATILLESVEEHLQMKRLIADLLRMDAGDPAFAAKLKVLQDDVEHHVEEEEEELFPKVRQLLGDKDLASLGAAMEETEAELKDAGNPRKSIPGETAMAAEL